jgi:L-threonylcarbamoyladenylate synthase
MDKTTQKIKDGSTIIPADSVGISEAVRILDEGGVIVYPTETVYGLGCDATRKDAVKRIADLKGRGASFIALIGSREEAERWTGPFSRDAEILSDRFWPGPLTLIFKTADSQAVGDERGTTGFRLSPDPVCGSLCAALKRPLLSTSANPRGLEPARDAGQASQYFGNRVDCILDDGPRRLSVVSTVLDLSVAPPVLIREGAVSAEAIERLIGRVRHV